MNHGETVRPVASATENVTALNPMGYPPTIEQLGMAPRFESLNGKTIYLVDVHFVDGDKLLQQMQAWFAEHLPKARTILASKAGVYTEDDPKLFSEIREHNAAAIMAVGH
jgi:predicted nucleotide-binding protein (sugar kinase/HSP70/actin superfamily)